MDRPKILIAMPVEDKQTGEYIVHAFKGIGCDVELIDSKLNPEGLFNKVEIFSPDCILISRTYALLASVKKIKQRYAEIPIACWNVDVRNDVTEFASLMELFYEVDLLYTIALGNVEQYRKLLPGVDVRHLPEGIDERFHKPFDLTEEDRKKYGCDVLFAGDYMNPSPSPERRILIDFLQRNGVKMKLYGINDYLLNEEHSRACRCAKIVLGNSRCPDVEQSMSARDYRVMGAGGFLLTNKVNGIEKAFQIGRVCDVYENKEDCLAKIKFYLGEEEKRRMMATCAIQFTKMQCTFFHRAKVIIDDLIKM